MTIRGSDAAPQRSARVADVRPHEGRPSTTNLDPHPWVDPVPWFLAAARLPKNVAFGYVGRTDRGPKWAVHVGDDGSWCAVRAQPDEHGRRDVREAGPISIWQRFADTHDEWQRLGRPGWERLGLTVTENGRHRVWLDHPDHADPWELPT